MTTPKLSLPELVVGQAGKELTHNQALAILDQLTQPTIVDKDLAAPPGSPANGSMYIVAASATGAWSGQSGKLAVWLTSVVAWTFITPANGWSVWVTDEAKRYELLAGVWTIVSSGGGGSGDVVGPASALGNDIARFSGTTGKLLKAGLKYQSSATDTTAGSLVIQGGTNLVATDTVAIGYTNGSGGSVTQATGKSTTVTLNKPSGCVTMNNASLAAGASVVFQINNTIVAGQDTVILAPNGSGAYRAEIAYMAAGGFGVRVTNVAVGALSDALNINFTIIKGALA